MALTVLLSNAVRAQKLNTASNGLAVKGYDVVAYFTEGRPLKGDAQFTFQVGDVTYRFHSAANRDLFAASPDRYAPQYGGFCAYAVSRNYTADIDPLAWKIVDGKLYLNYSSGAQEKWQADISGNIKKGDSNWPRLSQR